MVLVLATEQYPKGLGSTVPEVELAKFDIKVSFPRKREREVEKDIIDIKLDI